MATGLYDEELDALVAAGKTAELVANYKLLRDAPRLQPRMDAVMLQAQEQAIGDHDRHGIYHSDHEAYAVLLEEVDELWEHVKQKRPLRDRAAMQRECIQIAAVALRFADKCRAEVSEAAHQLSSGRVRGGGR